MFKFLKNRSLFYADVLDNILAEEKQLAKEWTEKFARMYPENQPFDPQDIRSHVQSPEPTYSEYILKRIWAYLLAMQRESRKIEEIQKLLSIEENKLQPKQERLLERLRRKLSWHPTKFRWSDPKFLDPVIEDSVKAELGSFSEERYSQLVKEVSKDEIILWEHLIKVKNRMLRTLKDLTRPLEKEKEELDLKMQEAKERSKDVTAKRKSRKLSDDEAHMFMNDAWSAMSVFAKKSQIENELAFFNRVREVLADVEQRLKKTKPR